MQGVQCLPSLFLIIKHFVVIEYIIFKYSLQLSFRQNINQFFVSYPPQVWYNCIINFEKGVFIYVRNWN